MASKKLKVGSELHGTTLGDPGLGLKAKWSGSADGRDRIAAVSKSDRTSSGAPKRSGVPPMSKRVSESSSVPSRMGYGGYGNQ